jgi:hypothetical protein
MLFLALRAYVSLLRFEASLVRGRFDSLYDKVRNHPVSKCPRDEETTARVCQAVDLACIWYWKQVLCLQRSAATVCLLRDNGVFAELVIGAQHMPFRAHAWVEVQGRIVNDKAYTSEIYAVLDRC